MCSFWSPYIYLPHTCSLRQYCSLLYSSSCGCTYLTHLKFVHQLSVHAFHLTGARHWPSEWEHVQKLIEWNHALASYVMCAESPSEIILLLSLHTLQHTQHVRISVVVCTKACSKRHMSVQWNIVSVKIIAFFCWSLEAEKHEWRLNLHQLQILQTPLLSLHWW